MDDSNSKNWKLVGVANNSQRRSDAYERVRRKMENISIEAAKRSIPVSPEDRVEVQRLKTTLQEIQVTNLREKEQAEVSVNT